MDRKKCIDAADRILKDSVPAAYVGVQKAYRELMKSDQENFLPLDGRIRHTLLLIRELIPDYREQFHAQGVEDAELDEFYAVYTTPVDTPEDDAPDEAGPEIQEDEDEQPPDSYYSEMDGWDEEEEPEAEPPTSAESPAPGTSPAANTEPRTPEQKPPKPEQKPPKPEKPGKPVPPAPTHPDIDPDLLDDLFDFDS